MNKYPVLFFPGWFANTSVVHMCQVQDLASLSGYSCCYGVSGRLGAKRQARARLYVRRSAGLVEHFTPSRITCPWLWPGAWRRRTGIVRHRGWADGAAGPGGRNGGVGTGWGKLGSRGQGTAGFWRWDCAKLRESVREQEEQYTKKRMCSKGWEDSAWEMLFSVLTGRTSRACR